MSFNSTSLILSLSNYLREYLSRSIGMSDSDITFESIGELNPVPDQGLSLFLYKISENPFLKNEDNIQEFYSNPVRLREPSLALDLYYLITPFGNSDNRLVILEQVLQHFYNNPVLDLANPPDYLTDNATLLMENGNREIKIVLNEMSVEQLNSLWNMFPNIQYRPVLSYLVSPLFIPSTRVTTFGRVISQNFSYFSYSSEKK